MVGLLLAAVTVFERVEPVEVRTGVVRVRAVEAPLLEIPKVEGHEVSDWEEVRFTRLYALDFMLETRNRDHTEREDRGSLLLAVRTGSGALVALDERMRALLSTLSADAFAAPLAGIREGTTTFLDLASISVEPSWACAIRGGRSSVGATTVYKRGKDGLTAASSSEAGQARRLCESFFQAAEGAVPEGIRTLPVPRELHEVAVEVEEATTLPGEVRREDLAPLPKGVHLSRKRAPGVLTGSSLNVAGEGSRSTYVDQEIEWTAATEPAALSPELLQQGAHVSRWSLRERHRRLGVTPRDDVRTTAVRTVAFVPIAPALLPDETASAVLPVQLQTELLREDVGHVLDAASDVGAATLELALRGGPTMGPQWLRSEGWLMVVCREDGSAWFGLPPTAARSTVTNPEVFCGAMERMLPGR